MRVAALDDWTSASSGLGGSRSAAKIRPAMCAVQIQNARFGIVSNGFATGPAQPLRDFLVERGAALVTTIFHPLMTIGEPDHEVKVWERGRLVHERVYHLPSRPPLTYPLDLLVPLWPPKVDLWVGYNALATWRGLEARRLGRAGQVVYWGVDFVRDRFGRNPVTGFYEWLDGHCCRRANARFELSEAARQARDRRHAERPLAPSYVVPMGAWMERIPITRPDGEQARKVVYLGSLIPTQGGLKLMEALGILAAEGVPFTAEVVGRGPLEEQMKQRAAALGMADLVKFHGFVADDGEVAAILASGSVGMATYDPGVESFTRWADPGKLKNYIGAGLPIVLTDVPPNARELESEGVAELVEYDAPAIARAIRRVLDSHTEFEARRAAALRYRTQYDWARILTTALANMGYVA
jgi:glycosyltransferase involved in cell wall biosynthesis